MSERREDTLANEALVHWEHREYERAMELLAEQERICRELEDAGGVARAVADQGLVMRDRGDDSGAQAKLREAVEVAQAAGFPTLVERIELRLHQQGGDQDALQESLNRDRAMGKAHEIADIFRAGRARNAKIRDDQETGLDETRRGF